LIRYQAMITKVPAPAICKYAQQELQATVSGAILL